MYVHYVTMVVKLSSQVQEGTNKMITTDEVKEIIEKVERKKETHFITSKDDEDNYVFHNSMPEKIDEYLNSLDSDDKIASESSKIGSIASELLKGL